jgi:amidase
MDRPAPGDTPAPDDFSEAHPEDASRFGHMDRRTFLKYGAYAGAAAAAAPALAGLTADGAAAPVRVTGVATASTSAASPASAAHVSEFPWEEWTIAQLQAAMQSGQVTSRQLVQDYIDRINEVDWNLPVQLNSVLQLNPDALAIADELDKERHDGHVRGPMHGIPILIKDNVATKDRMETTAGSIALLGSIVPRDAFAARQLRKSGAVLMGKTNLSEWANFRSLQSSSGWTGRAGQCLNPYVLDRNPSGSSSGSGAAASSSFAAGCVGSETDGSIVSPSSQNGLCGIKPTVGLISRAGVIPISHHQDTLGPMCRTVADSATMLGAMVGVDPRDPATEASKGHFYKDYTPFLDPHGLQGARIGVWRKGVFGFTPEGDAVADAAIAMMSDMGATVVDPANIPHVSDVFGPEFTVLLFDFKHDLNLYLRDLVSSPVRSLEELIAFDIAHADIEMPWFAQEIFDLAQATDGVHDPAYRAAVKQSGPVMRQAIDDTLAKYDLDAIVSLTDSPAWTIDLINGDHFLTGSSTAAAVAGYPSVTTLAGYSFGVLPVDISFIGTRWSEPTLIKLAYGFEVNAKLRHAPTFMDSFGVRDFVHRGGSPQGRGAPRGTGDVDSRSARPDVPGARLSGRL